MKISIVIPNYNGEELLKRNLPRVISVIKDYSQEHNTSIQLVITDDGSRDKSVQILQEYKDKADDGKVEFTVGFRERNGGFSSNVNFGVSLANGEIVILLNTDVVPDKGFIEPLLKHFEDDKVFAVGCMDKSIEPNGEVVLRGRGIGRWGKGFLQHSKGGLEKNDTLWVSGGSGAFRRDLWKKLGGLSEIMNPFYWEDVDLSYRGWKSGYKMIFEKSSTVVHEHEEGVIKRTSTPARVQMTALRNQFLFVWINVTDLSLIFSHLLWLPVHVLRAIARRDWVFVKGFLLATLKLPEALQYRARNKKLFKVSDRQIIQQFVD